MDDNEDWKVWQQAINPVATDFVRHALEDREAYREAADPNERKLLAKAVMEGFLRAAEAMAMDDISADAFGEDLGNEASHSEHLRLLADRIDLAATPFSTIQRQNLRYSLSAVTSELRYMAAGDPARILRPALREASKAAHRREVEHWARALEWVQFLKHTNKRLSDCRAVVADAYCVGIDSLEKDWKRRVADVLGSAAIDRIERAGRKVPIDFRFQTEAEGLDALKADGLAYRKFRNEKANKIHPISGS